MAGIGDSSDPATGGMQMPHRLKVLEQKTPTINEIIAGLAKAEADEIQKLKERAKKKR